MPATGRKKKLSTTISSDSYEYIERQISSGQASSVAEVVDRALERMRRMENRLRLERDTAAYFNSLSGGAAREEAELGAALGRMVDEVDLDA
jgi:Arc/MetJ-type ribon-helix-helix transcriptional regulator